MFSQLFFLFEGFTDFSNTSMIVKEKQVKVTPFTTANDTVDKKYQGVVFLGTYIHIDLGVNVIITPPFTIHHEH